MADFIKSEVQDRVLTLILDRPEKHNALNPQLIAELTDAFKDAEANAKVKVIILKSSAETFSAGADLAYLQQLQSNTYEQNLEDSTRLKEMFSAIYSIGKPVIAQVEGNAIAGGCGLASVCDFVFATPEALFGYTEAKIGFVPALVAAFLLRRVGEGRTRELLLSGNLVTAQIAYEYGLVNFIKDKSEIEAAVRSFANKLVIETSSQSLKTIKALLSKIHTLDIDETLDYAAKVNAEARLTDDCKKGISAFLNKKHPKW